MQFFQSIVILLFLTTDALTEVVNTTSGPVEGKTTQIDDGTFVNSWYGVPYAAPPIGNLRFEPPQPPQPWQDVFNATQLSNACIQDANHLTGMHPGWNKFSEDCLNLNIFAPQNLSAAPFAVMVWFYGGTYYGGANIEHPGHFLAAKGVVVVVPNYRLGAFGYNN